jgi:hypothetical protein
MTRDEWVEAAVASAPSRGVEDDAALDDIAEMLLQAEHSHKPGAVFARHSTKDTAEKN